MEMNPNFTNKAVFLKESQEEYITNLFGNNKNIRESYNREFNNVIVESTFNPKDEVKKFFSFLKENYINEIKKTNLINEQSSKTFINEQMEVFPWKRNNDFFGYWVLLYNTLKAAGIGVKCEVANNPGKSKFMYWGGWAINVDLLKNGGYPISFTDPATKVSMTFKFKGGKYAGQAANNIILEPKSIPPTFNLGVFGKISNKQMSDTILKYQKATPVATPQDLKIGQQVFNELKYAFDGAGTYENEAVAAFNKIKNKFQLDELNRLVKARGRFPNVYGWLQDEMSDYDYKQYRAIWDRLKSIDKTIVAPKVNNALRVVSAVGDVTGVNAVVSAGEKVGTAIKAGFTWLKDKGLPWFMEKLRDALGSTAGAVLQSLLDMTGIGAIGVSVLWAALTLFDVWQISSGAGGWAKLFFSVIGLLSAGALAKTVGTFLKPLFGTGGTIGSFFSGIANKPWFIKYIKPVVGWIGGKLSGAASLLTQAGEWVVKKLGATAIGGMVTKAVQWLKSIAENIVKFAGAGAKAETQSLAKAEVKTQGEKIFTKAVVDPLKDKAKEKVIQGSEYVGGTKGKAAAELAFGVQDLRKSSGDLGSAITKGDYVKTAEKAVKTYDKFGNVVDKGTQLVTNEPKKVTGPVG
jgi:predicted 3-demethylubiquinone-9 3-methyltransferase (glyoxalase superfamily)